MFFRGSYLLVIAFQILCLQLAMGDFDNCHLWAKNGECTSNPVFMWDFCNKKCVQYAKDSNNKCKTWANEGKCTKDVKGVALQCPESCQSSLSWNFWARKTLGIDLQRSPITISSCSKSNFAIGKAEVMRRRLLSFLSGRSVYELSVNVQDELFGMIGLAEAVLYAAKLYNSVLIKSKKKAICDGIVNEANRALSRYDGDAVMRSLRSWVQALDKASSAVYDLSGVDRDSPEGTCLAFGPSMEEVAAHFLPSYRALTSTAPVDSAQPQAQSVGSVVLSNGVVMPTVGLGTWQLEGEECARAVREAIRAGYRHFDSAQAYGNEAEIGKAVQSAIKAGLVTRKELFLATKMSSMNDYNMAKTLVRSQLSNLQTKYIDLYMLHVYIPDAKLLMESWRALEELVDAGVIKALGVSNFNKQQLTSFAKSVRIKPVVVQNKFDVYHVGKQIDPNGDDIEETCKQLKMTLVAWSSLNAHPLVMQPTADPIVQYVAEKYNCTPAQAILRWVLQRGALVIPRSTSPARLAENMAVVNMPAFSTTDFALMSTITYLTASSVHVKAS